jgi:uncharacterized SAM-binding protein YcdF (DUF218 family)
MSDGRMRRALRLIKRAAVVAAIVAALGGAAFLPFAGRYLEVNEPLDRADAIFVLAGEPVERWREGVDLHRENWAPRIVLSPGYSNSAEKELRAMGIRYPSEVNLTLNAIAQMGIPEQVVAALPNEIDNTAQEAVAIREMFERERWKTLIVVTSIYHSRRVQVAFRREFRGTPAKIIVRTSRYDRSQPRRWWTRRSDIRLVVTELQKLVLYRLGLKG